jgi:hypothetical protein
MRFCGCDGHGQKMEPTLEEYRRAMELGKEQVVSSHERGFVDKIWKKAPLPLKIYRNQQSKLAEILCARYLDKEHVDGIDTFKEFGDLKGLIEVRWVSKPWHRLTITYEEWKHYGRRPYILTEGSGYRFWMVGWLWGWEAHLHGTWEKKKDDYAWWINHWCLRNMETLECELESRVVR